MQRLRFACPSATRDQHGSTFVVVLGFVAVISMAFGAVLTRTMNTHRKVSHIASWQEALIAADAGGETAIAELRKTISDTTQANAFVGWDLYASAEPTAAKLGTVLPGTGKSTIKDLRDGKALRFAPPKLVHGGEGNTEMDMTVMIDAPPSLVDFSDKQWFRVRATGTTYLPGATLMAGDKRDLRLRRLSILRDGKLQQPVTRPQTTRIVEMIVKPIGLEPAIFSREPIDMNNANIVVNSYDSRIHGVYTDAVAGAEGDIATNSGLIDAGNASIYGDAYTNDGQVVNSANVKGEIDNEYFLRVDSKIAPSVYATPATGAWPTESYSLIAPAQIGGGSTVLVGAPGGPPKRVKISGTGKLGIAGSNDLVFNPIDPLKPGGEIEVWVPSDMSTTGSAGIKVGPGVKVKIYVEGSIYIGGGGSWNAGGKPGNLQVYGILYKGTGQQPAVTIAGNGIIVAAIYAVDHAIEFKATGSGGQVWGSIFGKSIVMGGSTHIHYDRALAEAGRTTDFRIKTWFEDNRY